MKGECGMRNAEWGMEGGRTPHCTAYEFKVALESGELTAGTGLCE
jgi:hypothetical protein